MTGNITWEMVASLFALATAIIAIWRRVEGRIKQAEEAASVRALAAQTKAEFIATELLSYKVHAAETYASKEEVTSQFGAVARSLTEFGDRLEKRLDGMNERLDRVIEAGQRANHSPSRRTPHS